MAMTLQQNQVWQQGDRYLRIVQLERMSVDYKLLKSLATKEGSHHHATKKEFCRFLKGARLLSATEVKELGGTAEPDPAPAPSEEIKDTPASGEPRQKPPDGA
jgi:hypothetical protein